MVSFQKVQPYAVVTIDLGTARTSPTAIGTIIFPGGSAFPKWVANTIVITNFPSGAAMSLALGDEFTIPVAAGLMTGSLGFRLEDIPFTMLYVQNAAQVGVLAEVVLAWVDTRAD